MQLVRRLRLKVFLGAITVGVFIGVGLTANWYRQSQLDSDLLAAIRRDDTDAAIALLNAGSDANAAEWIGRSAGHGPMPTGLIGWLAGHDHSRQVLAPALYLIYTPPYRMMPPNATPLAAFVNNTHRPGRPSTAYAGSTAPRYSRIAWVREPRPENLRLVRALVDHGADPNQYPFSTGPLQMAVRLHHTETVRLLLEHHADPNRSDEHGISPLMLADIESARLLIQHGANVNRQDSLGLTPLMMAAANRINDGAALVELLLESGAEPNARDKFGQTSLMHAVTVQSIKQILDHHGDLNARSSTGMSALMMDCMNDNDPSLSLYLLDRGADTSFKDDHGKTALDYATERVRINSLMMHVPADEIQLRQHLLLKSLRDRLRSRSTTSPN